MKITEIYPKQLVKKSAKSSSRSPSQGTSSSCLQFALHRAKEEAAVAQGRGGAVEVGSSKENIGLLK